MNGKIKLPHHKRSDARTYVKAHAEGDVKCSPSAEFGRDNYYGEGQARAHSLVFINRFDTPKETIAAGPIILNKGESIFLPYPRRINEGQTIRTTEDGAN